MEKTLKHVSYWTVVHNQISRPKSSQAPYISIYLLVEGLNQIETRITQSINTIVSSQQTRYQTVIEFLFFPASAIMFLAKSLTNVTYLFLIK